MRPAAELLRDPRVVAPSVAALLALAVGAALCSGGGPRAGAPGTTAATPTTAPAGTTSTSSSSSTSTTVAPVSWPLTGLPVRGDAGHLDQRVLAVKVGNSPAARPQAGLAEADLVVEVPAEGGVPRLLALFQSSDPARIGPVRSLREVDAKLLAPFDALISHSGGVAPVVEAVTSVAEGAGVGAFPDAYTRDPARSAPHDLFVDPEGVRQAAPPWPGPPPRPLDFDGDPGAGEAAGSVEIDVSPAHRIAYRHSGLEGGYLRFQDDRAHEDDAGRHLAAVNVVVLEVTEVDTGRRDVTGAPVPDYDLLGQGRAWVLREGRLIEGRWERGRLQDWFRLFDGSGREVGLVPGNTWLQLVTAGAEVRW